MLVPVGVLAEALPTQPALVRSFPGVDALVLAEDRTARETLATLPTGVGLLSRVSDVMPNEICAARKAFLTLGAPVGLLDQAAPLVLQLRSPRRSQLSFQTLVSCSPTCRPTHHPVISPLPILSPARWATLFLLAVRPLVLIPVGALTKPLPTMAAFVWLFTCMDPLMFKEDGTATKALPTVQTQIRPFSGMGSLVS